MRRIPAVFVGAAAYVLVVGGGSGAQAAPPDSHFTDNGSVTFTDFCGTGETVTEIYSIQGTFHDSGDGTGFVNLQGTNTLTADATGETVISHFAQHSTTELIENGDGTVTINDTITGLPEHLRLEHGGLITLDAGTITFRATIDEETGEVISEDITFRGPHPQAESGFELFCEVIPEALGIA